MPSFPHVGTAQQLLSNPMVTQAAVNYGQGLVDMGQSYIDRSVCVCMSIILKLQDVISSRLDGSLQVLNFILQLIQTMFFINYGYCFSLILTKQVIINCIINYIIN